MTQFSDGLMCLCVKSSAHKMSVVSQWNGHSALMIAARECRTEVVSLLLGAGADTDLLNEVN